MRRTILTLSSSTGEAESEVGGIVNLFENLLFVNLGCIVEIIIQIAKWYMWFAFSGSYHPRASYWHELTWSRESDCRASLCKLLREVSKLKGFGDSNTEKIRNSTPESLKEAQILWRLKSWEDWQFWRCPICLKKSIKVNLKLLMPDFQAEIHCMMIIVLFRSFIVFVCKLQIVIWKGKRVFTSKKCFSLIFKKIIDNINNICFVCRPVLAISSFPGITSTTV